MASRSNCSSSLLCLLLPWANTNMSLNRMHWGGGGGGGGGLRDRRRRENRTEGEEERGQYLVEFFDILQINLPLLHQAPLRGVQILYTQTYGESEVYSQATLPTCINVSTVPLVHGLCS